MKEVKAMDEMIQALLLLIVLISMTVIEIKDLIED